MAVEESIITQVAPISTSATLQADHDVLPGKVTLDLRGTKFELPRDELMALPESILICLFPNGVFVDSSGNMMTHLGDVDTLAVDFNPKCLEYILKRFKETNKDSYEDNNNNNGCRQSNFDNEVNDIFTPTDLIPPTLLQTNPGLIILREDLDYYVIPPISSLTKKQIAVIRKNSGKVLQDQNLIFLGLHSKNHSNSIQNSNNQQHHQHQHQHHHHHHLHSHTDLSNTPDAHITALEHDHQNKTSSENTRSSLNLSNSNDTSNSDIKYTEGEEIESEGAAAERHLQDMLCSSGFFPDSKWPFRELEPDKAVVTSIALIDLARGANNQVTPSAQKLRLFWRKPARKCWWDKQIIKLDNCPEIEGQSLTVHIRRVWTLELVSLLLIIFISILCANLLVCHGSTLAWNF